MCGLLGVFYPKQVEAKEAPLEKMLKAIAHRGPDGTGIHISDDKRFQLGFARLAIIDLETGDQPLVVDQGRRVLAGNGEIYNYLELRNLPEVRDYPYQTHGDMEVILPLAEVHGSDFVAKLVGMFALALYEGARHELTLVRDPLGIKPLYWAEIPGGGIIFASEIKPIFASGLISAKVDEAAVASYLSHGYVPAPRTLYQGVHKLAPGHWMKISSEGTRDIQRYWRPKMDPTVPRNDPQACKEIMQSALQESVALHMRSDVPVGALLSGGFDSGLCVAMAAQTLDRPLKTYTVRFEGQSWDETPLARLVAERYGTDHQEFTLSANSIADHLPSLVWHCEEPLSDASLLPNHLIEKELSSHVRVVLNGTGGDELFAGYMRYFQMPVEQTYLKIPAFLRHYLIEPTLQKIQPMTAFRLARAEKFFSDRGGYLHDHCTFFPEAIRQMIGNSCPSQIPYQRELFNEFVGPAQSAALAAELGSYLPEDLLLLLDRTSMAWSVEGRVPFLTPKMAELALAVSPEIRTPNNQQKGLERAIAKDFLPEALMNVPKRGFASPVPAWFNTEFGPLCQRILTRPQTLARGWWSKEGIARLMADTQRHGFRLYALLYLELCVRMHVEGFGDKTTPLAEFAE